MSIVVVRPEILAAAAGELHTINEGVRAGNVVADDPTTGVVPAATDLVSLQPSCTPDPGRVRCWQPRPHRRWRG